MILEETFFLGQTGLNFRAVSRRSLKDVSCIYHDRLNFELVNSVGKEFTVGARWVFRTFAYLGAGQANKGSPWVNAQVFLEGQFAIKHRIQVFTKGYFGFGKTSLVNIRSFDGYAKIHHQSIDVGVAYVYLINPQWGTVSLSYSYRPFARAFPEKAQTAFISYNFPFSFF